MGLAHKDRWPGQAGRVGTNGRQGQRSVRASCRTPDRALRARGLRPREAALRVHHITEIFLQKTELGNTVMRTFVSCGL